MATIIGAGFASGQEIVRFFSSYYEGGFYGIILAGILFSVIGYIVLDKVYRERIRNYEEFLFPTVGWFLGWIMEVIVSLFMLSVFCIMIAGMRNIVSNILGIPYIYSAIIMSICCILVILTDIKGVVTISTFVTPVLITGIVAVGLYIILYRDIEVFNVMGQFKAVTENWFFSALIYVSYNSIISIVVMCGMLPYLKTRRVGVAGGIIGGGLLCFVAFILNTAIFLFYPDVLSSELPILGILQKNGSLIGQLYMFILLLAMFISAVTSGYGLVDRISRKVRINTKLLAIVLGALAIPLSGFGFSNLIAAIYPVFGYVGLFMIFAVFLQALKLKRVIPSKKLTNR